MHFRRSHARKSLCYCWTCAQFTLHSGTTAQTGNVSLWFCWTHALGTIFHFGFLEPTPDSLWCVPRTLFSLWFSWTHALGTLFSLCFPLTHAWFTSISLMNPRNGSHLTTNWSIFLSLICALLSNPMRWKVERGKKMCENIKPMEFTSIIPFLNTFLCCFLFRYGTYEVVISISDERTPTHITIPSERNSYLISVSKGMTHVIPRHSHLLCICTHKCTPPHTIPFAVHMHP